MATGDLKSNAALGFLTVVEHPKYGLFGGYLVLNAAGQPLEFHCTAPIKPNRAQQILYGPTLESFLYGDQIGHTLLQKAVIDPLVICTDQEPALSVRQRVSLPVVLVLSRQDPAQPDADGRLRRFDGAHATGIQESSPGLIAFQLGANRLAVPQRTRDDRALITERLAELSESFDLVEPFGRIREAIEEAQQAVR